MLTQERPPLDLAAPVADAIAVISYRSRANERFDWRALDALTRAAQARNRASSLTGVLLYEDGRFFQTIEGPPALLAPVWEAIRGDPRHREVEVLSSHVGTTRLHAGWDMRWLRKGEEAGAGLDFLEPAAPSERLAALALGADEGALAAELARLHDRTPLPALLDYALEPTARALGDAWLADDIDALSLDMAVARLCAVAVERGASATPRPAIGKRLLAAAFPREPHLLGAVAAFELHTAAGWWVDLKFPDSEAELVAMAAGGRYDRIDVAASDAIDRGERARAAPLAAAMRAAAGDRRVEIGFGGRAFWERGAPSGCARTRFRSSAAALRFPDAAA